MGTPSTNFMFLLLHVFSTLQVTRHPRFHAELMRWPHPPQQLRPWLAHVRLLLNLADLWAARALVGGQCSSWASLALFLFNRFLAPCRHSLSLSQPMWPRGPSG